MAISNLLKKLTIVLMVLLSSCTITKKMWMHGYQDRIQYFAVSKDGKYVAFIGRKYHYILADHSNILKDVLSWQYRGSLIINNSKTVLKVDDKNNIEGEVFIETISRTIPKNYWAFLQGVGFKEDGKEGVFFLKIKLGGQRYLPRLNEDLSKANLPALTMPYEIFINEKPGKIKTACMAALTPITMTLDGALLIGKVILMPFSGN